MRNTACWRRTAPLLAAACLLSLMPVQAAMPEGEPNWPSSQVQPFQREGAPASRELPEEDSAWLALPNGREDRLERYRLWAEGHPDEGLERVILQVNLDLDQPVYDNPRTVEDPASLTVLVNKRNRLPEGYVPELEALGAAYGSGSLRPEAARAFRAMADAAREEGIALRSVSAYRSFLHQQNTYDRYLKQYQQKTVDRFSARPGFSEHQTGLALDINAASGRAGFEATPAFAWLKEHCAQYGFILRYDQGKEAVTGYRFEPWHYRYVGQEIAQVCMEQGLSYEEYLALGPDLLSCPEVIPGPEADAAPEPFPVPIFEGVPIEV